MRASLETIPAELLLQIISHLPTPSYLQLVHTSPYLSYFFASNAAVICNNRIRTEFSFEAAVLLASLATSWLLPRHPCILTQENRCQRIENEIERSLYHRLKACCEVSKYCNCLSKNSRDRSFEDLQMPEEQPPLYPLPTHLTQAGPQFLLFLEKYSFEIRTRHALHLTQPDKESGNLPDEEHFAFMLGTYAVRPFLQQLEALSRHRDGGIAHRRGKFHRHVWSKLKRQFVTRRHRGKGRIHPRQETCRGFMEITPEASDVTFGEAASLINRSSSAHDRDLLDGLRWFYRLPVPQFSAEEKVSIYVLRSLHSRN